MVKNDWKKTVFISIESAEHRMAYKNASGINAH